MGRSNVISNINQALPTNGNDEISAQDLRGVLIADVVNEFMNLEDDAEIPVYSSVKSYKLGKLVLNQDVIWRALANVLPNQIPPTLPATSNIYWKLQGTTPSGRVGRVLFVSKDGNNATAIIGSQSLSYLTIQAAVNASVSGDLIVVFSGTYSEMVNYNGTGKNLKFKFHNVTLNGGIIGGGVDVDGTYSSSIIQNTDQPIAYSESGTFAIRNMVTVTRTVALQTGISYDIANQIGNTGYLENVDNLGTLAQVLRINGLPNAKLKINNVKDVYIYQQGGVVGLEFNNCRLGYVTSFGGGSILQMYIDCKIRIFSGEYFGHISNATFQNCDIYIDNPSPHQFTLVQNNASGVIKMDSCNIQSTNPTFGFLFKIASLTAPFAHTLIIDKCKGNIPLANIKDYTATNELVDYQYVPFLTTFREVTN